MMTRILHPAVQRSPLTPFGAVVRASDPRTGLRHLPPETVRDWTLAAKVLVLRGFPLLGKDELVDYCGQWGEIVRWDFGAVLDLVIHEDPRNYLFSRGDVPFHWDGAFASATPSFFLFQCVEAPAQGGGGETVFCDTAEVVRRADEERVRAWEQVQVTYRTDKVAHYGGQVTEPLLRTHPVTGERVIRYAEPLDPDRYQNPLFLTVAGIAPQEVDGFTADMRDRLHDPAVCYHHEWQDGDIVVVDNHALVHGRNAFAGDSSRHLQRVQIVQQDGGQESRP